MIKHGAIGAGWPLKRGLDQDGILVPTPNSTLQALVLRSKSAGAYQWGGYTSLLLNTGMDPFFGDQHLPICGIGYF